MDLKEDHILGESVGDHWYYRSKLLALLKLLTSKAPERIADIGAGSGFFSRELLARTGATHAICIDIHYPEDRDFEITGKPLLFRRTCNKLAVDTVLMMDVLEHTDDDIGMLREYVAKTSEGTRFVISVPAFSFLWSEHDVYLDHRRRYDLNALESVVRSAGLEVERGCYYFGFIFPLVAAIRILGNIFHSGKREPRSHLKNHSSLINTLLATLCRLELPLVTVNRLAGVTVFCVARKPGRS